MIKLYPTKVEARDSDTGQVVFVVNALDQYCAEVDMRHALTDDTIDNVTAAMRGAMAMLDLKEIPEKKTW